MEQGTPPQHRSARTPVVLVAGVDATAMGLATLGLQLDLPDAVTVHHSIDPDREVLTRTVSDLGGVVERVETRLAHACVTCAIREDILPTLERVAREGRWPAIVAHLPVGTEPAPLCAAAVWERQLARQLRISAVVTAVAAASVVEDLLGADLLAERGLQFAPDDRRGVGEVLCAMVESSDVVVVDEEPDPAARNLLSSLARPDAMVRVGGHGLDPARLLGHLHVLDRTDAWTDPVRSAELPESPIPYGTWRLDLRSEASLDPVRLLDVLEVLGSGRHRSRGCFWLPTRPATVIEWDGAGGQVSVGQHSGWGRRPRFSRILWTGVGSAPDEIADAFAHALSRPEESVLRSRAHGDGFEPWLGPIEDVA